MSNFAIGNLPANHIFTEEYYYKLSRPPSSLMNDYVLAHYKFIGAKILIMNHNYSLWGMSGNLNLDYTYRLLNGIIGNSNYQPLTEDSYSFNCSSIGSRCWYSDNFMSTFYGLTLYPFCGLEVYFSANPNAPVNSNYSYSGIMEIGDIGGSFWHSHAEPASTACEFKGIVDIDLPSDVLLDNFDSYIPNIRFGVYALGNVSKIIINGAVAFEGKVHDSSTEYRKYGRWSVEREYTHKIGEDWFPMKAEDYPNILRGNYPILIEGSMITNADTEIELALSATISTYNCKFLYLQKDQKEYIDAGASDLYLSGLVTSNYQNSMPSLIIS